ncbi:MAG: LysR family transcriptional regulator [Lachnospiraceae bacterium]|nr:LysR family transcriptional regulator [Lachnospiraceae bacterium]
MREFVTLIKENNYFRAAEKSYINQSTLSKHIHMLETEVGADLLYHNVKKVALTSLGKSFYFCAVEMLEIYDGFFQEIITEHKNEQSVYIAIPSQSVEYGVSRFILGYDKFAPDFNTRFYEYVLSDRYDDLLYDKKVDFLFLRHTEKIDNPEVEVIPFVTDRIVAVLPSDHPLAGRQKITLEEIANEKLIGFYDPDGVVSKLTSKMFSRAGIPLKYDYNISLGPTIIDLVKKHKGVSIRSKMVTEYLQDDGVALVDFDMEYNIYISILYRANEPMTPARQSFLDFINQSGLIRNENSYSERQK